MFRYKTESDYPLYVWIELSYYKILTHHTILNFCKLSSSLSFCTQLKSGYLIRIRVGNISSVFQEKSHEKDLLIIKIWRLKPEQETKLIDQEPHIVVESGSRRALWVGHIIRMKNKAYRERNYYIKTISSQNQQGQQDQIRGMERVGITEGYRAQRKMKADLW